ncbi:DUF1540 domain-containing protein [Treponema sp. R6D11]
MDNQKILAGVGCEAKDCKYNYEGCKCCAPSINVTGKQASCTPETACETFVKNQSFF